MNSVSKRIARPFWVAGLTITLVITVGTTQAFADTPITNQAELEAIGTDALSLAGSYVVTRGFEVVGPVSGGSTYVTGTFTGTFDGGGFTISGLTKPIFTEVGSGSVISALNLKADVLLGVSGRGILANDSYGTINNVNVTGSVAGADYVGGLVGTSAGSISDSSATGDVSGTYDVGGLVGYSSGSISDSSARGNVNGGSHSGGLVGVSVGSISASSSYGNVNGTNSVGGLVGDSSGAILNSSASGDVSGSFYVGGLVGNSTSSISGSYSEGDVSNTNAFSGGLVGYSTGNISNSYTVGSVTGNNDVGGLIGYQYGGNVSNSYSTGDVVGYDEIGGLVGYQVNSSISNSYAFGDVNGNSYVGGLVGTNYSGNPFIVNSYASGAVNGYRVVGGLVGDNFALLTHSYSSGVVTSTGGDYIGTFLGGSNTEITDDSGHLEVPFTNNEILNILNRGSDGDPIFALNPAINNGLPYLISNAPPGTDNDNQVTRRVSLSFLPIQVLDGLRNSVGFEIAKSDLNKLDLALLDKVKDDKAAQIIGAKLPSYQSLSTYLSIGSLLQLEINYEANKSLQIWVKSSDDQYVLIGDITFDKDGNAVLPGIEFKKSGLYEFIFVNSAKKGLAMPELANKVSGLTVYVN